MTTRSKTREMIAATALLDLQYVHPEEIPDVDVRVEKSSSSGSHTMEDWVDVDAELLTHNDDVSIGNDPADPAGADDSSYYSTHESNDRPGEYDNVSQSKHARIQQLKEEPGGEAELELETIYNQTALENFECFHHMESGTATLEDLYASSAGFEGWLNYKHPQNPKCDSRKELLLKIKQLFDQGDCVAAKKHALNFLDIVPDHYSTLMCLFECNLKLKMFEEADEVLDDILGLPCLDAAKSTLSAKKRKKRCFKIARLSMELCDEESLTCGSIYNRDLLSTLISTLGPNIEGSRRLNHLYLAYVRSLVYNSGDYEESMYDAINQVEKVLKFVRKSKYDYSQEIMVMRQVIFNYTMLHWNTMSPELYSHISSCLQDLDRAIHTGVPDWPVEDSLETMWPFEKGSIHTYLDEWYTGARYSWI